MKSKIEFTKFQFHPVVFLPQTYEVYDFTQGYDENRLLQAPFGVGKYNEKRKNMYTEAQYQTPNGMRDIHMGIDIGAPIGTPVHAFYEGEIFLCAYNSLKLDYGHTIITKHVFDEVELFCLLGHLSKESLKGKRPGQKIQAGEVLGWLGDFDENGGWNPHVHIQLSYDTPKNCNMPGAVNEKDLIQSLEIFPDPRNILGPLY